MSDNIQYIDVDHDDYLDTPKALRDHVKRLQARLTEQGKELDGVRGQLNSRALSDVLADKGFKNPTRVQKDMLADKIDPTDSQSVVDWLAANSDDYARATGSPDPVEAPPAAQVDPDAAGYAQLNVGDTTAPASLTAFDRAQQELAGITSPTADQVRAVYLKHGV